jgi:hypothetical protein
MAHPHGARKQTVFSHIQTRWITASLSDKRNPSLSDDLVTQLFGLKN